jgi:hypothetical protein
MALSHNLKKTSLGMSDLVISEARCPVLSSGWKYELPDTSEPLQNFWKPLQRKELFAVS